MRLGLSIKRQNQLKQTVNSILSDAVHFTHTQDKLLDRLNEYVWKRAYDEFKVPRHVTEYLRGYVDAKLDALQREHHAHGYYWQGKVHFEKWEQMPDDLKEFLKGPYEQVTTVSGIFWKVNSKPYFFTGKYQD